MRLRHYIRHHQQNSFVLQVLHTLKRYSGDSVAKQPTRESRGKQKISRYLASETETTAGRLLRTLREMDRPPQEAVETPVLQNNRELQDQKSPVEKLMEKLDENQKIIQDVQQQVNDDLEVLLELQEETEFFNGTYSPLTQSEQSSEDIYIKTDETLEEENEMLWKELEDLLRERKQFGLFLKQQVALWETRLSLLQSCDEVELRKNLELFVATDKSEFTEVMKHQCKQHTMEEEEEDELTEEEDIKDQLTEEEEGPD
ncbi:liprin-alpha-2-like isoform X2 [Takifugu flavidus]|uniref:liprin-alpha-2-like isoform X2 n=1 Tax=Takifugu flavidus TaxID=433684 RepID=UPI0025447FA4|nr:liprin-alpha-2-like isoform X2 [Takifugu flavidus]